MNTSHTKPPTGLSRPIDGYWLALYRIALGGCLLWQVWKYFSADLVYSYYIEPTRHFSWPGFDFIQPWSGSGMYFHFAILGVAAMCILLGFWYRLAAAVFFIGYTWVFLMDVCWYLNHYYLICLLSFLAVFLPANRELSIDALRDPSLRRQWTPQWTRRLLQFQIAIPYIYGGIAKLNSDWLHGEPMRSWLAEQPSFPVIGQYFQDEWCVNLFVFGGLIFDLLIVPLLLWKRTRLFALIVAILFHLLNSQLFSIGVFPWLMILVTITLFTEPDTLARLRFRRQQSPSEQLPQSEGMSPLFAGMLGLYVILQILIPLRQHLYAGQTAFTDEGHPFSWRMKLNNRFVDTQFFHVDAESGTKRPLPLFHWTTFLQERKLADADQLLQCARWMADDLIEQGVTDPVITVDATVALNGRPPEPFVDPDLDLTKVVRTFSPPDWINLYAHPTHLSDLPPSETP